MKIKKNTFSTLVLELFFPSIANCRKLKSKKIQKSTSPSKGMMGQKLSGRIQHNIIGYHFLEQTTSQ
jgi:hypothetical protein